MSIVFRVDASRRIGSGHLMRCLTLADALRSRGDRCLFISRNHEGALMDAIVDRGHALVDLPMKAHSATTQNGPQLAHHAWLGANWEQDAEEAKAALGGVQPEWLIVDHYALDARWERELRPYCKNLMAIDDLADRDHDCDLVLDQNLGRSALDYADFIPNEARVLTGPRYALLRPEFAALRAQSLARRAEPQLSNILLTMGGVDLDNATERVLDALDECALPETVSVTVVMGSAAPWLESVRNKASVARRPTTVLSAVKNMALLMSDCDLAIGAAGSTSWERCCLGVPSVMVVLAENQAAVAAALDAHGAALNVGDSVKGPALAAEVAVRLHQNPGKLKALADAASDLCDGEGAQRVCEILVDS